VIETGPDVAELDVGALLYINADPMEYVVAREDGLLLKLPEDVIPQHAALFGMSGVAMRSCRHADLRIGERVRVVGQGLVGPMAARIANVMGARVAVCEIDPRRLELARRRKCSMSQVTDGRNASPMAPLMFSSMWRASRGWRTS